MSIQTDSYKSDHSDCHHSLRVCLLIFSGYCKSERAKEDEKLKLNSLALHTCLEKFYSSVSECHQRGATRRDSENGSKCFDTFQLFEAFVHYAHVLNSLVQNALPIYDDLEDESDESFTGQALKDRKTERRMRFLRGFMGWIRTLLVFGDDDELKEDTFLANIESLMYQDKSSDFQSFYSFLKELRRIMSDLKMGTLKFLTFESRNKVYINDSTYAQFESRGFTHLVQNNFLNIVSGTVTYGEDFVELQTFVDGTPNVVLYASVNTWEKLKETQIITLANNDEWAGDLSSGCLFVTDSDGKMYIIIATEDQDLEDALRIQLLNMEAINGPYEFYLSIFENAVFKAYTPLPTSPEAIRDPETMLEIVSRIYGECQLQTLRYTEFVHTLETTVGLPPKPTDDELNDVYDLALEQMSQMQDNMSTILTSIQVLNDNAQQFSKDDNELISFAHHEIYDNQAKDLEYRLRKMDALQTLNDKYMNPTQIVQSIASKMSKTSQTRNLQKYDVEKSKIRTKALMRKVREYRENLKEMKEEFRQEREETKKELDGRERLIHRLGQWNMAQQVVIGAGLVAGVGYGVASYMGYFDKPPPTAMESLENLLSIGYNVALSYLPSTSVAEDGLTEDEDEEL